MSAIEDHPEPVHLLQQIPAARWQTTLRIRAVSIHTGAIVRRADRAQSIRVAALQMLQRDERVRAFEAHDVTDGRLRGLTARLDDIDPRVRRRKFLPQLEVRFELRARADGDEFTRLLHRAIPRELPLRLRPRLCRRGPARQPVEVRRVARDLRRHTNAHLRAAQLGEAQRVVAPVLLVRLVKFAAADTFEGPRQIAVPLQRVHGEVEMCVEDEHIRMFVGVSSIQDDGRDA